MEVRAGTDAPARQAPNPGQDAVQRSAAPRAAGREGAKTSRAHKSTGARADGKRPRWPILTRYDRQSLARIAMPLGGIGTGTVSLGGRGDLRDWEIMNRPAKGNRGLELFFMLFARPADSPPVTRLVQGPVDVAEYEGSRGCTVSAHGLPRFRRCTFAAAYPLGQVFLTDRDVPLRVRLEAFNPFVPADADASGIPCVALRYVLINTSDVPIQAALCGSITNLIAPEARVDEAGHSVAFRRNGGVNGLFLETRAADRAAEDWGTAALVTTARRGVTARTAWTSAVWSGALLELWEDFSADGRLTEPTSPQEAPARGALAVHTRVPAQGETGVTFLLTWHFPNRYTWTPRGSGGCTAPQCGDEDRIGNYYTTRYRDAWDVAIRTVPELPQLEKLTLKFVQAFCGAPLPHAVLEAALFNLSTLRSQTCFRTPDGRFFGWEGCNDSAGCCLGSCTHVWNYEQATAFLFGALAKGMREVEFEHATDDRGMMSFRVHLPLTRAQNFGKAAADGQMGCIMKVYRDWQLSGDETMLARLWPDIRKALEFCWITGGWDADRDGVMEGCQHNTMDVEYFGPNPQMQIWYLGALRAAARMAAYVGDNAFAATCTRLAEHGAQWTDAHLFNGEYYEHEIRPPAHAAAVAECLRLGMPGADATEPAYQLGAGCLVDQLVGQFMAHVCGLGYLVAPRNVRQTLRSIMKYNYRGALHDHFNTMRTFALADESALLMASYPRGRRPARPFPYFTEVMTGFEYTAAVHMLYEGQTANGLKCIEAVRARYDGRKRSPFDEAECGHHYARAMASWAAVLALTGFRYSGVTREMQIKAQPGRFFWANGYAWGTCAIRRDGSRMRVTVAVDFGRLHLETFSLAGHGTHTFDAPLRLDADQRVTFPVARET